MRLILVAKFVKFGLSGWRREPTRLRLESFVSHATGVIYKGGFTEGQVKLLSIDNCVDAALGNTIVVSLAWVTSNFQVLNSLRECQESISWGHHTKHLGQRLPILRRKLIANARSSRPYAKKIVHRITRLRRWLSLAAVPSPIDQIAKLRQSNVEVPLHSVGCH